MTIAMIGIIIEIRTPGFGVPGALGITSLALFFWGHWLVQLVGWEELLLAAAGVILLLIEVLVIPGFGVAGILGIAAILASLILSVTGPGDTPAFLLEAAFSLLFALLGSLILLRFLPRLPFGRQLILERGLTAVQGYTAPPEKDRQWLGKKGRTSSPLRPAGIAEIDGERVDVVSDGDMIDAGEPVEVTRVDGNRIVVRRLPHATTEGDDK
jgi:membrane-bound serine protease (ClpP class)